MPLNSLLEANQRLCDECIAFINSFDAEIYRAKQPAKNSNSSIGAHIRHTIEFFQCLLNGLASNDKHIDYDKRARDTRLEIDRSYAIKQIQDIKHALLKLQDLQTTVTVNETLSSANKDNYRLPSTIARELMFAHSHMVHHFSMIKLIAESHGITVSDDFGKAPSTVIYENTYS